MRRSAAEQILPLHAWKLTDRGTVPEDVAAIA